MLERLVTILYLSGEHISLTRLAKLLDVSIEQIQEELEKVPALLLPLGLLLLRTDAGVSIVTSPEQSALVETFWKEELKGELTPAALQVLTLVAYLYEGTREQISYIRGVQSNQSIRTLLVRGLLSRDGEVCRLTSDALKQLGITRSEELPEYEKLHQELLEKLESRIV